MKGPKVNERVDEGENEQIEYAEGKSNKGRILGKYMAFGPFF
jgi:hypothetical protein